MFHQSDCTTFGFTSIPSYYTLKTPDAFKDEHKRSQPGSMCCCSSAALWLADRLAKVWPLITGIIDCSRVSTLTAGRVWRWISEECVWQFHRAAEAISRRRRLRLLHITHTHIQIVRLPFKYVIYVSYGFECVVLDTFRTYSNVLLANCNNDIVQLLGESLSIKTSFYNCIIIVHICSTLLHLQSYPHRVQETTM